MKKKSIATIALFIAIIGILLVEYFVVSYFIRYEYVVGRFMSEVPVITEADKIETYVRSFQNAVDLSLLQGLYDIKNHSQDLWYDYIPNMPDENKIKEMIIHETEGHAREYLREYSEFASKNAIEMDIPNPVNNPNAISGGFITDWTDSYISIEFFDISFKGKRDDMKFDRSFTPSGKVNTQFKRVWDLTYDLITNDKIGKKIRDRIKTDITNENDCTVANVNNIVNDVLGEYVEEFNKNDEIKIDLTLENSDAKPIFVDGSFNYCQVSSTVKVIMEDKKLIHKYPVYDGSGVTEDYLGLIYKIRTGN